MAIYVQELERGGYNAYGGCRYDARERLILLDVFDNEKIDVTIEFASAPSELNYFEDGIDGSAPVISGNTVTVQFQDLQPSGRWQGDVIFASGAKKTIVFMANPAQPYDGTGSNDPTDDEDVDYGAHG